MRMSTSNKQLATMVVLCVLFSMPFASGEEFRNHPFNCGLHCLNAAFECFGKQVDPSALLKPQYVSAERGSTISDLVRAAKDLGFSAAPFTGLSVSFVRHAKYPVILSVRSRPSAPEPDHYWVALPATNGEAHLVDAMYGESVEWDALRRGYWNGVGVVISQNPLGWRQIHGVRFVLVAGACVAALALSALLRGRMRRKRPFSGRTFSPVRHVAVGCVIVGGACLLSCAEHSLTRDGSLIGDQEAVRAVQMRHIATVLPRRSYEDIAGNPGKTPTLVDARWSGQYVAGHIDKAVNLPPDATPDQLTQMLKEVAPNTEIVVYCDNPKCSYAEALAGRIWGAGHRSIAIYRGGWREWEKRSGRNS